MTFSIERIHSHKYGHRSPSLWSWFLATNNGYILHSPQHWLTATLCIDTHHIHCNTALLQQIMDTMFTIQGCLPFWNDEHLSNQKFSLPPPPKKKKGEGKKERPKNNQVSDTCMLPPSVQKYEHMTE